MKKPKTELKHFSYRIQMIFFSSTVSKRRHFIFKKRLSLTEWILTKFMYAFYYNLFYKSSNDKLQVI